MAQSSSRLRRIVRRAVMAMAVAVLLVAGYVGSAIVISFAFGIGWIPFQYELQGSPVSIALKPLHSCIAADLPGGRLISRIGIEANRLGRSLRE